jgi:hypothetical protein
MQQYGNHLVEGGLLFLTMNPRYFAVIESGKVLSLMEYFSRIQGLELVDFRPSFGTAGFGRTVQMAFRRTQAPVHAPVVRKIWSDQRHPPYRFFLSGRGVLGRPLH